MAYNYYQQSVPGWGTNQFQFGPPPAPSFQPQPSWGGMDYYRAHALTADPSLFDYAWNRVRDYPSAGGGTIGVGIHEARHWHRRAYGGLGELNMMAPAEIGHAAAYEAYRTWIHNSSIYEPLSGDIERQREGLIGLAVAEATRLLQYSNRSVDSYARMAASEAAAHTASFIFYQSREGMGEEYRSRSRYREGGYEDPYAYDDQMGYPRGRSWSRHRSRSRHGGYGLPAPTVINIPGTTYSTSGGMPGVMPGMAQSGYAGQVGSSYGGGYGSYSGNSSMPMQIPGRSPYRGSMPIGTSPSYQGSAMPIGISPSSSSFHSPSYAGSSVPMVIPMGHSRSRSSSFSYPQQPYLGSAMSTGSMGMHSAGLPQAQTIIIHKPHKKHRHHRHRSRARSSDRY